MSEVGKVLLIGWDGATWDYINPLLEQRKLPNLEKLLERGARAVLKSTTPPYTAIAWPALVSGSTSARTGVYDVVQYRHGSYAPEPAQNNQAIPIWDWANRFGKRVGILNVPTTFPAPALEGYLVSGFDSPRESSETEYPQGTTELWAERGHPYQTLLDETALMDTQNPHQPRGDLEAFTQAWINLTHEQGKHLAWLWQNDPVDLLFAVFSGTDSINHRTWDPNYIRRVYQAADEALGEILRVVDSETLIYLVSDHGSIPADRFIAINRILTDLGWIQYKKVIAASLIRKRVGPTFAEGWRKLPFIVRKIISAPLLKIDSRLAISYENVDWKQTKIFLRSSMGPLYVNLKGRFPEGCVELDELESLLQTAVDKLLKLTDDERRPLFRNIYLGRELYPEAAVDPIIPDLILEPFRWSDHLITGYPNDPLVRPISTKKEYGTHTPDGILLIAGPGIKNGAHQDEAHIQDVVPTILAAWGLPIPERADGNVLHRFFKRKLDVRTDSMEKEKGAERLSSQQESDEVLKRLRALGYLD